MPVTRQPRNLCRHGSATAVLLAILLGGCPKRFDPRAETVRTSPDRAADDEYRQAKARLDIGDHREAEARFAEFLERHPDDPLAPSARIGEARAALALGQPKKAEELLRPLAASAPATPDAGDPTAARARYLLGLAQHSNGEWARSRALLKPFVGSIASGDDAVELHAVLADDAAHLDDAEEALREYDAFFAGARPAEKQYIRDRVAEIVTKLSTAEATRLWGALPRDSVAVAYLGRRLAAERHQAGDEAGARQALDDARAARDRAGVEAPEPRGGRAQVQKGSGRTIGCLLPLSGKQRGYGERALRGALLAADLIAPPNLPSGVPVELKVRDTGSDPARAAQLVDELAAEGVMAIVGSPDRVEAQLAAPRAAELGVPFLELAPDDVRRGDSTFKLVRQSDARARALARLAVKSGARTLAVLAPDSGYGRAMAAAFADEARRLGARVVLDQRYPEASTTFIEPVRRIREASPAALFVPAPTTQLQLIAPQLSASGVTRMPGVKPSGRQALLYATADGLNERFLNSTAKYLEGAVLAPLFYPDASDARAAAFLERYRGAYNEDPSSLDALAFDAVRAVRLGLDHADGDRAALGLGLGRLSDAGLTGALGFGPGGERAGQPPLFTVEAGAVHALGATR